MEKINYSKWFWIGLISVISYVLFAQIMLSIPSADDLNAVTLSNYLLLGKKYYYDFFEINPPLIFWITTPIVFLNNWFHISAWTATLIFGFVVWCVSFLLCINLVQRIFIYEQKTQQWVLFFIIITTLVIPNAAFGEREPLAFMLILPYLLLIALRLQKKITPSSVLIFSIALLAAIGFLLKPYFLLCFILIEIFYVIKTKAIHWNRIELWTISIFTLCYLLSIGILTPAYYEKVLPLARTLYLQHSAIPISMLMRLPISLFPILGLSLLLGFSILFLWADDLFMILILSAIAFYCIALIPRQYWYYHFIPATQCVFLALTYFICLLVTSKKSFSHWKTLCLLLLIILGIEEIKFSLDYSIPYEMRYNKNNFFYKLTHTLNNEVLNAPVYLISNTTSYRALLAYFANVHFVGRSTIVQLITPLSDPAIQRRTDYVALKSEIISIMVADIEKNSPQYLMIDRDGYWLYENDGFIHKSYFSFLRSNPRLNAIFKQYCFSQQIINFALFRRCV